MMDELNIIRKVVWSYVKNNRGLEFDDIFSEGCLAYLEAAPSYNPMKGQKSTFIWRVVSNRINNILKNMKKQELPIDIEITAETAGPEQILLKQEQWEETLANFSPEASAVYYMIEQEDFPIERPKKVRGAIVKKLRDKGWSHGTIWSTFREIKEALKG